MVESRLVIGDQLLDHKGRTWDIRHKIPMPPSGYEGDDSVDHFVVVLESPDGFVAVAAFDHKSDPNRRTSKITPEAVYPNEEAAFWAYMTKHLGVARKRVARALHMLAGLEEACDRFWLVRAEVWEGVQAPPISNTSLSPAFLNLEME